MAAHQPVFEFWNDTCFQKYRPQDQAVLAQNLFSNPCPTEVLLPDHMYKVVCFDHIWRSGAVQVKLATGFARTVRLKPPYHLSSPHNSAGTADNRQYVFQYRDAGWQPYEQRLQTEFNLILHSVPVPEAFPFCADGKVYRLVFHPQGHGLKQVNIKTGKERDVWAGPLVNQSSASATSGMRQFGASASSSSSQSRPMASPFGDSILQRTSFRTRLPGLNTQECRRHLLAAWLRHPRPDQVPLPGGAIVENFTELEFDRATIRTVATNGARSPGRMHPNSPGGHGSYPAPLKLEVKMPSAGNIQLPDELDDDTADFGSFGHFLSSAQVQQQFTTASAGNTCSICLTELCDDTSACSSTNDVVMTNAGDLASEEQMVFQLQCGHAYHAQCLKQWFHTKRKCPQCQQSFGKVFGTQPKTGLMSWSFERGSLPGHPNSTETIVVRFDFPGDVDDDGNTFQGRREKGFLPGDAQGAILLELFKVAFRRRSMFGLGNSMMNGTYRPTFNIHIKTRTDRGVAGHGYPDPDYFKRSMDELSSSGVSLADLAASTK